MVMESAAVNTADLIALKERMKLIASVDPKQYHNEFSLRRYLLAFKTVDAAFQVALMLFFNGITKTNVNIQFFF